MITYQITAPCRPLTSNQRLHHQVAARLTRDWRLRAAILSRKTQPIPHAHVTYWIHATTNRRRDVANYYPTVKACLDGIVDSNVLPDDSDQYVVGPDPRPGDIRNDFTVVITLDPTCHCGECRNRFATGRTA